MTLWRDGMGRVTQKYDTGTATVGDLVFRDGAPIGVCRRPGWVVISGQWVMRIIGTFTRDESRIRERARRRHANHHAHPSQHDNGEMLNLTAHAEDE